MKELVKKIVPNIWVIKYREFREHGRVKNEFREDAVQYNNSTNFHLVGSSDKGVKELLIFHTHALEKGLSHPHFRPNFGKRALSGLKVNLDEFERLNLDKNDFSYQNAISVLKFYKNKHKNAGIDTPFFDSLFNLDEISFGKQMAGAEKHVNKEANGMSFEEFEYYRTTQREFSHKGVDSSVFDEAVKLALKTPSVCNRQPWKVYTTSNKNKIAELLRLQKGFNGYELPPTLSLVTVDRRSFIGSYERNEAYIDGGLFLMNFDFSLTYFGLASCILNSMLPNEEQRKVKKILGISPSEVLIAFVAAGYPKDEVLAAKSARKPTNEVLKLVD